jgi:hypothetical protein
VTAKRLSRWWSIAQICWVIPCLLLVAAGFNYSDCTRSGWGPSPDTADRLLTVVSVTALVVGSLATLVLLSAASLCLSRWSGAMKSASVNVVFGALGTLLLLGLLAGRSHNGQSCWTSSGAIISLLFVAGWFAAALLSNIMFTRASIVEAVKAGASTE